MCNAVLISKKKERFAVPVTAAVEYRRELVYLEVSGSVTATEAIRARIHSKRDSKRRGYATTATNISLRGNGISDYDVSIDGKAKYPTIMQQDPRTLTVSLAIFHEGFTKLRQNLLLGGTQRTPSPWFPAVVRTIEAPTLDAWMLPLWREGIKQSLINECKTIHGDVRCWSIQREPERWQSTVSDLVRSKKLKIKKG